MSQDSSPQIVLASASPRRRILLQQLGIRYRLLAVEVDETWQVGEAPEHYVRRLALEKARVGWLAQTEGRLPVLAADTAVVIEGEVLGKPRDPCHGLAMLERLSGRSHRVLSAVALVGDREATQLSESTVTFRTLSQRECRAYGISGEGADKAGGYAIQGQAAAFVRHLAGSYSGVMGLPLYETAELLSEFGIDIWNSNHNSNHWEP
jgi:septum formation protein